MIVQTERGPQLAQFHSASSVSHIHLPVLSVMHVNQHTEHEINKKLKKKWKKRTSNLKFSFLYLEVGRQTIAISLSFNYRYSLDEKEPFRDEGRKKLMSQRDQTEGCSFCLQVSINLEAFVARSSRHAARDGTLRTTGCGSSGSCSCCLCCLAAGIYNKRDACITIITIECPLHFKSIFSLAIAL